MWNWGDEGRRYRCVSHLPSGVIKTMGQYAGRFLKMRNTRMEVEAVRGAEKDHC